MHGRVESRVLETQHARVAASLWMGAEVVDGHAAAFKTHAFVECRSYL